ncbi:MAG TPA: hypothetical protein VMI35_00855 [Puia sp.]|nr:hypothetical protein [Puia sp.]
MQPFTTDTLRREKLDDLVRSFLSQPGGSMSYETFCCMTEYYCRDQQESLLEQLLEDEFVCFQVTTEGLELTLTELGIVNIVMGGYVRERTPQHERKQKRSRKVKAALILFIFYTVVFACAYFSLKR